MIAWPWVSRRAYRDAVERAQRAEAQLAVWMRRALDRTLPPIRTAADAASPAAAATARPAPVTIPPAVRAALDEEAKGVNDPAVMARVTAWAVQALREGTPVAEIVAGIEHGDDA